MTLRLPFFSFYLVVVIVVSQLAHYFHVGALLLFFLIPVQLVQAIRLKLNWLGRKKKRHQQ